MEYLSMRTAILFSILFVLLACPAYGEMYKWVDEKGTVHFTDDPSTIPEKYRSDAEFRKTPKDVPAPKREEKPTSASTALKPSAPEGLEVPLMRRGEVLVAEVILNGRAR